MSEIKDRVKEGDTQRAFSREIVKKSLLPVFKEKFEGLAPICRDRIVDPNAEAVCTYHESSPTDCRFSICPRLDLPLHKSAMIEANSNLKRGKS